MATEPFVYKILTEEQWLTLKNNGKFTGSPVDLKDGYIHLSSKDTVEKTADLSYILCFCFSLVYIYLNNLTRAAFPFILILIFCYILFDSVKLYYKDVDSIFLVPVKYPSQRCPLHFIIMTILLFF
jgi:Protein of unknown function (DUF952)